MSSNEDPATRIAVTSALGTGACVALFGLTVFVSEWAMYSYASSMGISMCFLVLVVANESLSLHTKVWARLATAFGIVYCTLVCIVYYTQLSFVRLGSPSQEALDLVSYQHTGSAFFSINILGYFFMSLSVLCLGLSISNNKILTRLLVAMGIWGGTCISVPLLPFFYQDDNSSSDAYGVASLALWSILFLPLMILLAQHYQQIEKKVTRNNKMD